MIVYSATKAEFHDDVMTNGIGDIIHEAFQKATRRSTSRSEVESWINSLQYMDRVLADDGLPGDSGVAIEYHLPQTSKRIDFILTGKDSDYNDSAVLVELKQWQSAGLTNQDAIVTTKFKHGEQQTAHPSYQAWSYKRLLEDFNQTVQEDLIQLYPCAYLHNYEPDNIITNEFYSEYTALAPVFLKPDALKLRDFLKAHVKYGDKDQIMYRIDHGKIKPSKNLADQLVSMLEGNEEFVLIDDQKVAYETAIHFAEKSSERSKNVLIVEGGPGTGKSVLAINILVALTQRQLVTQYVTRNSAPRLVYEAKLTGTLRKSHISNLFSSSGSYHSVEKNVFDCLIVDEAHRLNEKSGMFNHLGENQIKEIIRASKCSVFFIDEDQTVTLKDIGEKSEIRRWAEEQNAEVTELNLESQFRCNGSDGYLAWLDNALQIRETANVVLDTREYDFRIIDCPRELHDLIKNKNQLNNKARMLAGYCWKWVSKKSPLLKDIQIDDYKATWNLDAHGQAWIIQPDSVNEVGCIHTSQGLEVDYVGVIVGPDLVVRDGRIVTQVSERASTDKSVHGWKKLHKEHPDATLKKLDTIIKNTYRTLMTRGQKGCYVYFTDEETRQYFADRIILTQREEPKVTPPLEAVEEMLPFKVLPSDEVIPYENCVPLYDLKASAGLFSEEQHVDELDWVELPDFFRPRPGLFVAQVIGESMNRRIPNGSWCLFSQNPVGTRQGKVVLVETQNAMNSEGGGHYTVKVYESTKKHSEDGTWQHGEIFLKPDSYSPEFRPIVIKDAEVNEYNVVAEYVAVLGV